MFGINRFYSYNVYSHKYTYIYKIKNIVNPVLRNHLWYKEKVVFYDRWLLKRGSIPIKISMTGQKGDLLIKMTVWAGLSTIRDILVRLMEKRWKFRKHCVIDKHHSNNFISLRSCLKI